MHTIDDIFRLLETRGQSGYFGEPVSQLEHALECADLALEEGASNELIAAALLHDVGHLLHGRGENIADQNIDTAHEELGQAWLSELFGPRVTRPIALHVAAKRYLCATDKTYLAQLSSASLQSLKLQGGPMDAQEIAKFDSDDFAKDAVRLRRWDDLAKIQGKQVRPLSDYRKVLESVLNSVLGAAM